MPDCIAQDLLLRRIMTNEKIRKAASSIALHSILSRAVLYIQGAVVCPDRSGQRTLFRDVLLTCTQQLRELSVHIA